MHGIERAISGRWRPPPVTSNSSERDRVEREFLAWREDEMKARLEKTLDKLRKN